MTKHKIIKAYSEGSPLELIADSFKITLEEVKDILLKFKEDNKNKNSFTDEFKRVVAERDLNGVARSTISKELSLNINTVRKFCELFGQAMKDKAYSDNEYTRIDGKFSLDICPKCNSKRNNLVDENVTFCLDCNSEHEYYDGYILRVNFEYID